MEFFCYHGSVHIVDLPAWTSAAVPSQVVPSPDPRKARAVLNPDRYADIEVHNWRFGGRPS